MSLEATTVIEIPDARATQFDHGAFDARTRRVFVAHTARDRLEVLDHDHQRHVATLPGFAHAAGVVADQGEVLVANRGAASLAWVDADTLATRAVFDTGPRPNGVALVPHLRLGIVACIGDDAHSPALQVVRLDSRQRGSIDLPGRPRWCVTDAAGTQVFLAIREPSMVLAARLPDLAEVKHWRLPAAGAHGLDIDRQTHRLYVACDGAALVEMDAESGKVLNQWPLAGVPDATFFNPASGWVHVAIEDPGLVQSIHPGSGARSEFKTGPGAKTTALVAPRHLYVFSPAHRGALVLSELGGRP
jgi:hypothetical protein